MHAAHMTTPVLLTAGAQDECTPPSQALEFYNAAREAGAPASVAIYPEEGHGVTEFPALVDFTARILDWFTRFMPPERWSAALEKLETVHAPTKRLHTMEKL